jgi:hypothetical protein
MTAVVTLGVVVLILLFERKRAERITRDLRQQLRPEQGEDRPPA